MQSHRVKVSHCLQIQLHAVLHGESLSISGVGVISGTKFWVSSDPSASYLNADQFSIVTDELPPPSQMPSSVFVHDACWVLLLARLESENATKTYHPNRVAQCLRDLLKCFPCDSSGGLLTRFDYGGVLQARRSFGRPGGRIPKEMNFLLVSPILDIASVIDESQRMPSDISGLTKPIQEAGGIRARDPFRCLPSEILDIIFTLMTSADLCSLRLASRAAAANSSPTSLSQSFWRSRFTASNPEVAWFLAGQHHVNQKNIDWAKLYRFIRQSRDFGIANKKRIWSGLSDLYVTLSTLLEYSPTTPGSLRPVETPLPDGYRNASFVQSHVAHLQPDQHVIFPWNSPVRLSLSFIHFNCRYYVSGLRLQGYKGQGDGPALDSNQVGLIIPTSEEHLDLGRGELIKSVRVYSLEDGIVGIEFHVDRGSNGLQERLLGGSVASNPDAAVGELVPDVSLCIQGFSLAVNV